MEQDKGLVIIYVEGGGWKKNRGGARLFYISKEELLFFSGTEIRGVI